jgi:hypothetical protein
MEAIGRLCPADSAILQIFSKLALNNAFLVESSAFFGPRARFSIPVTFYVQTRSVTAIPLKAWIGDGSDWTPVPGELCGSANILEAGVE